MEYLPFCVFSSTPISLSVGSVDTSTISTEHCCEASQLEDVPFYPNYLYLPLFSSTELGELSLISVLFKLLS